METTELLEVYKSLFDTWRFEVNSHWQRSSYFAAFETVAIAACWKLLTDLSGSRWLGAVVVVLGILLTAVWFLNNNKTHFYAVYWLKAVSKIENTLVQRGGEEGIDFATQILSRPRHPIRHRHLVQAVPLLFLVGWVTLFFFAVYKWRAAGTGRAVMIGSSAMYQAITYEFSSLVVAVASLFASVAAIWIARSSLSQAKQVADRDQRDWKQRKWFDLYFKADEAYDALERFQALYTSTSSPGWGEEEWEREWNDLMRVMRGVHRMALVFPKNSAIDELLACTAVFKDEEQAVSNERLSKLFDAVEGVRQKALIWDLAVL